MGSSPPVPPLSPPGANQEPRSGPCPSALFPAQADATRGGKAIGKKSPALRGLPPDPHPRAAANGYPLLRMRLGERGACVLNGT